MQIKELNIVKAINTPVFSLSPIFKVDIKTPIDRPLIAPTKVK